MDDEGTPLEAPLLPTAWDATAALSAAALAPLILERRVWPRKRMKEGTLSTSKDSDTSGCSSASIYKEYVRVWLEFVVKTYRQT